MIMDGSKTPMKPPSMGDFGEPPPEAYQFTTFDQDAYAIETLTRARKAGRGRARSSRDRALLPDRESRSRVIANDEHPLKVDPPKFPGLKPAFRAGGTITPAASSANADAEPP